LITSVWIVIQERVLSFVLCFFLRVRAGLITVILPASVRQSRRIGHRA